MDINQPVTNPKIKELFVQRGKASNEQEYQMIMNQIAEELVMHAKLLSVITLSKQPIQKEDGSAVFEEDSTMQFPMLTTADEQSFYPVFIDWEELGKWEMLQNTTPNTLVLTFDDYVEMIKKQETVAGIVIDPFSDNLILTRAMLLQWSSQKEIKETGHTTYTAQKETVVHLGEPKEYPTEMIEAIISYAKKEPSIREAWLRLMEKDGELSYLIVVDFDGDKAVIFDQLAKSAIPYLNNMYIDLIPYTDEFGMRAVQDVSSFYHKKKKKSWFFK